MSGEMSFAAEVQLVKRLKELEPENGWLRKVVPGLTLDKLILSEALRGNYQPFAFPEEVA